MGGIYLEAFFGRNFLGGFFWRIFWEDFYGRIFGRIFFGRIIRRIFWEEFFGRNYLVEINKKLMFLSRFWGDARRKEGLFILLTWPWPKILNPKRLNL